MKIRFFALLTAFCCIAAVLFTILIHLQSNAVGWVHGVMMLLVGCYAFVVCLLACAEFPKFFWDKLPLVTWLDSIKMFFVVFLFSAALTAGALFFLAGIRGIESLIVDTSALAILLELSVSAVGFRLLFVRLNLHLLSGNNRA